MLDLIFFRTKRDKSGNVYYITIDFLRKTAVISYNMGPVLYEKSIELTKAGFNKFQADLEAAGFIISYV